MREFYAALDIENQIKDGDKGYPRPDYDNSAGISLELRYESRVRKWFDGINYYRHVSFSYPNTTSDRPALKNVSFTIHPGQLVVIVGCNGSGKSTLIKLLNRLYDPTSGTILVDGIPIQKYRIQELRRAIAMLTQDHQLFPLSVEENIVLGAPDEEGVKDSQKLEECVRLSGAEKLTNNFSEGFQTVLDPIPTSYISFYGQGNEELGAILKKMKKSVSLSGEHLFCANV